MVFGDLPVEILPGILYYIVKPQHLVDNCLVNKTFQIFATPRLYDSVVIYSWHKEGKQRVIKLFDTLSRHSHLASLLHRLEIRDFPKAVAFVDDEILNHVLRGLRNCTNLRSCRWTRDGSLNSEILEALHQCSSLREFEFNGHDEGRYNPRLLLGFTNLLRISIIMPSAAVVSQLNPWLSFTGASLRSFTLICKASSLITDTLLESIAPHLVHLDHLHLTGCPKITHRGIWTLVSSNIDGLLGLGLEGVSPKFDMSIFAAQCVSTRSLHRLRSITLTVHQQIPIKEWIGGVIDLLSTSPLELFQIYSSGAFFESPMTDEFWSRLIRVHGDRLIRFAVQRMLISLDSIRNICTKCPNLQQLFIVIEPTLFDELSECLSHAEKLNTVHINYPLEATEVYPVLRGARARKIIDLCSPTLALFGCNARVWKVERQIVRDEDGTLRAVRNLARYDSPEIPEQFLVVRT